MIGKFCPPLVYSPNGVNGAALSVINVRATSVAIELVNSVEWFWVYG